MSLNIRLRADENVLIENSLGKFDGRFNLTATGAFDSPVLLGDIDLVSGDFYFQDRSFRVINGRLSFVDPINTEPYLDFRGETYVKDYRVTLSMSGPVSRLKPEFSSSPPLPPEEILSLLALGESFQRTYISYSGDRSTAMNTASLLTYQIADLAKKRTGGLLLPGPLPDRPLYPGNTPGGIAARITVGKKISATCSSSIRRSWPTPRVMSHDRRGPHLPHGVGHQQEVLARRRAGRPGKVEFRCQVPQTLLGTAARGRTDGGPHGPRLRTGRAGAFSPRGPGTRGRRQDRRPGRRTSGGSGTARPHPHQVGRRLFAAARRPGRQADLQHRPLRRRPGHEEGEDRVELVFALVRNVFINDVLFRGPKALRRACWRACVPAAGAYPPGGPPPRGRRGGPGRVEEGGVFRRRRRERGPKEDRRYHGQPRFPGSSWKTYRIGALDIEWKAEIPERALLRKMKSRVGEVYVPNRLAADLEALSPGLGKSGYRRAEVRLAGESFDDEKRRVDLRVEILPQEKITIVVNGAKVPSRLLEPIWEERVFEQWGLAEGEARVLNHLRRQGYLFATVQSRIEKGRTRSASSTTSRPARSTGSSASISTASPRSRAWT